VSKLEDIYLPEFLSKFSPSVFLCLQSRHTNNEVAERPVKIAWQLSALHSENIVTRCRQFDMNRIWFWIWQPFIWRQRHYAKQIFWNTSSYIDGLVNFKNGQKKQL